MIQIIQIEIVNQNDLLPESFNNGESVEIVVTSEYEQEQWGGGCDEGNRMLL